MSKRKLVLEDFEEVFNKEIVIFGNSSHIILPHNCKGKRAVVIIENKLSKK